MDCDTEETRATQKLYNGGMTKYNVDISGEDKDKVIGILNRLDEQIELLEKTIDFSLANYYNQDKIEALKRLKKVRGDI